MQQQRPNAAKINKNKIDKFIKNNQFKSRSQKFSPQEKKYNCVTVDVRFIVIILQCIQISNHCVIHLYVVCMSVISQLKKQDSADAPVFRKISHHLKQRKAHTERK